MSFPAIFDTSRCGLPYLPLVDFPFVKDCVIPDPPNPIFDCQPVETLADLTIPPELPPPCPVGEITSSSHVTVDPEATEPSLAVAANVDDSCNFNFDFNLIFPEAFCPTVTGSASSETPDVTVGLDVTSGMDCSFNFDFSFNFDALTTGMFHVYRLDDCQMVVPSLYAINLILGHYVGGVVKVNGHCYHVSVDDSANVIASFVPIEAAYPDCTFCHGCWRLEACLSPTVIITNTDLSEYAGRTVKLDDGNCYNVIAEPISCDSAVPVTVDEDYEDCITCSKCFTLVNCQNEDDIIITYTDLTQITELSGEASVGKVLTIGGTCYEITAYGSCEVGANAVNPDVTFYDTCSECGCYLLTPCSGGATRQVAGAVDVNDNPVNLDEFVGEDTPRAIRVDGVCYTVSKTVICDDVTASVTIQEIYDHGCDKCVCYGMEDCANSESTRKVYTDFDGLGYVTGDVFKEEGGDDTCWRLTGETSCDGSETLFKIAANYSSCDDCTKTTKYLLSASDCGNPFCPEDSVAPIPDIVTTTDLSAVVGQIVSIGSACYTVSVADPDATVTEADLSYDGPMPDCATCASSPKTDKVAVLIPTPYINGDNTGLCFPIAYLLFQSGIYIGMCSHGSGDVVCVGANDCDA